MCNDVLIDLALRQDEATEKHIRNAEQCCWDIQI
jgi:hypothetical protein